MTSMDEKIDLLKRENAVVQAMNDAMAAEGAVLKAVYSRRAVRPQKPGSTRATVIVIGPKPKPAKEAAVAD